MRIAATVGIFIVAASGPARADDWWGRDKALHFGASATLALGGYGAAALFTCSRPVRFAVGGGLALGFGVGKELADRHTGGDPSLKDLGWDALGTATGLLVAWGLDRLLFSRAGGRDDGGGCVGPLPPDIRHPAVRSSAGLWIAPKFSFDSKVFRIGPRWPHLAPLLL